MILDEDKGIMDMIKNQKIFLKYYKTFISTESNYIDAPLEGLAVTLHESIMKKVFIYTKVKV